MIDKDLEKLYALNLKLFDSWESMLEIETNSEAREAMIKHLEALDLVLGFVEKSIDKKDQLKRELK